MEKGKGTGRCERGGSRWGLRGAWAMGLGLAWALAAAAPAPAVTIDWVTVGDPGNAADPDTGFGSVSEVYRISKTEVTNAQYAEFLNAVAASDPTGLYNPSMGSSSFGGIARSGSSGSFSYDVKAFSGSKPVNFVSFWDSLRFANWLHNGQPTGAQGASTTEDGAYTITAPEIIDNSITRNAGANIVLTSEDEWYKAAYYDSTLEGYFEFPAGSDVQTTCAAPGATANTANCETMAGDRTDVGSYTAAASPNGTFDQGGNVWEWNEAIIGSDRGIRGGAFNFFAISLAASSPNGNSPASEIVGVGFRVASPVPEPELGTGLLVVSGLLGLAGWRRRRA